MELIDCSVNEILRRLDSGAARSADLALQCVARTDRAADLNCYVAFDADVFLRQAREADERRRSGERLALLGVPIAVKDNIQALGFACGNGTAALDGQHPRVDAGVVQRLRAAGRPVVAALSRECQARWRLSCSSTPSSRDRQGQRFQADTVCGLDRRSR